MKTTAAEIRATNKLKAAVGDFFRSRLSVDELHVLGVNATTPALADELVEMLLREAHTKKEERRKLAAARSPLIGERYAVTLARSLAIELVGVLRVQRFVEQVREARHLAGLGPWASVTKDALHLAYMRGSPQHLHVTPAHPGSREGLFVVDLRDLSTFATRDGYITLASITARVTGAAQP